MAAFAVAGRPRIRRCRTTTWGNMRRCRLTPLQISCRYAPTWRSGTQPGTFAGVARQRIPSVTPFTTAFPALLIQMEIAGHLAVNAVRREETGLMSRTNDTKSRDSKKGAQEARKGALTASLW